jgi:integrase
MGSIRSRSGKLFFDFRYRGVRCREQTKLSDNPVNRKRATTILERIEAEILVGTFDYATCFPNSNSTDRFRHIDAVKLTSQSSIPSFQDFAETWFTENEPRWKYSYKITLRTSLDKHILPIFGGLQLDEITKSAVLAFRANLARIPRKNGYSGLSPSRINHVMVPLRSIMNEAAERYEFSSPFKNIKPLKVGRTDVDPFTLAEVRQLIDHVRPDYKNYLIVRFFTGMRTGEVHGLKWKHVDFANRQILVRESFVAGQQTTTKTDGSTREIQMSQPVFDALKLQSKVTCDVDYVFANTAGNPLSVHNVTKRIWYPLLRRLCLPLRRPYQTRHTAATLWLAAGENPEWIARQMGHSTTEMLFRIYSRYVPNLTRQDGSAFESLLKRTLNK